LRGSRTPRRVGCPPEDTPLARSKNKQKRKRHQNACRLKRRLKRKKLARLEEAR